MLGRYACGVYVIDKSGLAIISPISPGVETPGYFLPSLRDCESPVRATDNSPAIHCRVGEVRTKPDKSYHHPFEFQKYHSILAASWERSKTQREVVTLRYCVF